jgi:flagellar motor switch protein FliN
VTQFTPRIAEHLASSFGQAAGSLTGTDFEVSFVPGARPETLSDSLLWQQSFSGLAGPALWLEAGRDLWETLARITLEAAGLESVTEQDARSTWQELLGQAFGAFAAAITADILREVTAVAGAETSNPPAEVEWHQFRVVESVPAPAPGEGKPGEGNSRSWTIRAAWLPELEALYEPAAAEEQAEQHSGETTSRTFDLLLDVSLPVAVSFGRTSLQIREVLKLNTGSIVELNRFVSDPVEIIVNDRVIARGEVVVVDGNYGVRINQLATREDRLRTGMAERPKVGAQR